MLDWAWRRFLCILGLHAWDFYDHPCPGVGRSRWLRKCLVCGKVW